MPGAPGAGEGYGAAMAKHAEGTVSKPAAKRSAKKKSSAKKSTTKSKSAKVGAKRGTGSAGAAPLRSAAFFDLDRTILSGASGPAISAALRSVGLMSDRSIPGQDLFFRVFNSFGETLPSMFLTRQAAAMAARWPRELAQQAGRMAAETLIDLVQPYAKVLIDQHRAEGRLVVLATTSPYDLVKPLADLLGLDGVIATRYGERDGLYDGSIDGEFVWSHGKFRAVRDWADEHRVSLSESYAYSDSYYDVPLLNAVGHPFVVNPDPRMRLQAMARRWPTLFLDVPPGVPKLAGIEPQRLLFPFVRPGFAPYVNLDVSDTEYIPHEGPAILCANHRSYFDVAAVGFAIAKEGRPVRFLGKKEVFDAPFVGDLARAMGGIRVERGTGSDEPLKEALTALEAGEMVVLMPQGTIPRGLGFFDPVLKARWGAARLAAMSGAPVIPMGLWGTEKVWPRNAKIPNLWNVTDPPKVSVRVGPPVALGLVDPEIDSEHIMSAIVDLLPPEARERHEPTAEELAATMPSNVDEAAVAAEHEAGRRPGVD
jgi:putative phosphoserine phosphatase/1-acylglycerol-3-phosphate O-acyltransferase